MGSTTITTATAVKTATITTTTTANPRKMGISEDTTPIIIGVGQLTNRGEIVDPFSLLQCAVNLALEDVSANKVGKQQH